MECILSNPFYGIFAQVDCWPCENVKAVRVFSNLTNYTRYYYHSGIPLVVKVNKKYVKPCLNSLNYFSSSIFCKDVENVFDLQLWLTWNLIWLIYSFLIFRIQTWAQWPLMISSQCILTIRISCTTAPTTFRAATTLSPALVNCSTLQGQLRMSWKLISMYNG